ncbi:protein tweety homolog 2-like isoform X1 [Molothrus ater]|uniref:protein tweety homolog 2-like isoform X1 n=1 Tax=Molothrus ater TaxID=84834 RepID=UPI00174E4649|nr:protein tweety homolog 2-like isoform X1 [Molothrus ater]XP_036260678.1 protein tweety homolog 2-like isoform X1 [Molothrus ater]
MGPARADYLAPWWAAWLHGLPHRDPRLQPVPSTFRPQDPDYQQSLLVLGLLAAVCLGLNLLFLTAYLICLCCCKRDQDAESKRPHSCCVTWMAVTAGLICCAAVGIGFYGNSETNDGVFQLLYALDHANQTLTGIDSLVASTTLQMQGALEQHLARLNELLASRGDYVQTLKFTQQLAGSIVLQLQGLPAWRGVSADLTELSAQVAYVEYYRWLAYLLFFILVLTVCLLACLGLAKHSRCLLLLMLCCGLLMLVLSWASMAVDTAAAVGTSDFCVAPDKFIMNQTDDEISAEVVHYYLYCDQSLSSPFQQALTVFQRSLTTMQIQMQGLIQYALPLFPTAEKDLLGVQQLLNSSETSLHQLTALLDCRGLHKDYLDGLIGICYDGVEGLLYLGLFSLLAAAAFSTVICAAPRAWQQLAGRERDYDDMDEEDPFNPAARRMATHRPPRGQLRSFCSYSSSLGSQSSLQPPAAQTVSNAPVSEYMNQAVLFGGNPRYENVPLIGRGSPPPTLSCPSRYSPSMRATYLAVTDEHIRHRGDFPA